MASHKLVNLASLLIKSEEDEGRSSRVPSLGGGMRYALIFAEALIPLNKAEYVNVSGFSHYKTTGLFFASEITGQGVKVSCHPVDGSVMMFLGKRTDFAFPSRAVRDGLEPICFNESEMALYAQQAAEHLAQRPSISEEELDAWRALSKIHPD